MVFLTAVYFAYVAHKEERIKNGSIRIVLPDFRHNSNKKVFNKTNKSINYPDKETTNIRDDIDIAS